VRRLKSLKSILNYVQTKKASHTKKINKEEKWKRKINQRKKDPKLIKEDKRKKIIIKNILEYRV